MFPDSSSRESPKTSKESRFATRGAVSRTLVSLLDMLRSPQTVEYAQSMRESRPTNAARRIISLSEILKLRKRQGASPPATVAAISRHTRRRARALPLSLKQIGMYE